MTSESSTPPVPESSPKKALFVIPVALRRNALLRWVLAIGLGSAGGLLLNVGANPFPTAPPSIFPVILIALGFAAFFLSPETDLEG